MKHDENPVLIITLDMIPYAPTWGSCQRMYYLADYLQEHGHEVYVVHAKNPAFFSDFGHKISFHQIPIPVAEWRMPAGNNKGFFCKASTFIAKWMVYLIRRSGLYRLEAFVLNEPYVGMGISGYTFSRNARDEIAALISGSGLKNVIISAPPFSVFSLAPWMKRNFPGVQVIFDYRDPWNSPFSSHVISSLLERIFLKSADTVVFLNDRMREDSVKTYSLPPEKCRVILNGFSETEWKGALRESDTRNGTPVDTMVIAYVGNISFYEAGYRDIGLFLDAFAQFSRNRRVLLRFVGVDPGSVPGSLRDRLPGNVEFLPNVATRSALSYMLKSDVLLMYFIEPRTGRYVLTGKLFDYIRSGKVIFGVAATEDTYFLEVIRKKHLVIGCLHNAPEITRCLEELYGNWERGTLQELRTDPPADRDRCSRDAQNSRFLDILRV